MAVLAAAYFITGKLGLTLAFEHPSATGVWPPAGIALAALLIFGYQLWPAILLGAFLVNITTMGSPLVCLGIATGNTLEALAGTWLVNRYAGGRAGIYRTPHIFKFALLAGLASTTIAATFGATGLTLGGYAQSAAYSHIWITWWLGDAVGIVLIAPLVILWYSQPRLRWRRAQFFEAAVLVVCLLLAGLVVFDGSINFSGGNSPEYICIPFLIWVAYRFGQREAAAGTLILAASATFGTLHSFSPLTSLQSRNASLLTLEAFVGVVAVTTMGLAAVFAERRGAEEQARLLSLSDPLTGLGNYRKLIDTLESEIRRSSHTGRPFALLLMDLDGLKQINDAYGHLTGSRALCRLADVLRVCSRAMDTAARYGGDEFALILPEAGPVSARQIAQRVASRVAGAAESPSISVSIGLAEYPADGETVEKLLYAADMALYRAKHLKQHGVPAPELPQPAAPKRR
jgi:diguanylate cyclase (GGDEF)-like protein